MFCGNPKRGGAQGEKIPILASDKVGNPPAVDGLDWSKTADGTWKYNASREALAPNFNKYANLSSDTLEQLYKQYHQAMNETRLTEGEFKTLLKRINEGDYKPLNRLNSYVSSGEYRNKAFCGYAKAGVEDSKVMARDITLQRRIGDKKADQNIPEALFDVLYQQLQKLDLI